MSEPKTGHQLNLESMLIPGKSKISINEEQAIRWTLAELTALRERLAAAEREWDAAVSHHTGYTKAIDLALGEPRYSGSLQQSHCTEIELWKGRIAELTAALAESRAECERLASKLDIENFRRYHDSSFDDPPSYHDVSSVKTLWDCPQCVERFIERATAKEKP